MFEKSLNYIKPYHKLFLWAYPMRKQTDIVDNVHTTIYYKLVNNSIYIMKEEQKIYPYKPNDL